MVIPSASTTLPREFCRRRTYPSENELSGGHVANSTSESSSSTCDTSGSLRRNTRKLDKWVRGSPIHSIKRPSRIKFQQYVDPKDAEIICRNCDSMRLQLTEAKTQCYDQWLSRIKILEDMLQEKQKINDDIQADYYAQCHLVEQERAANVALKKESASHLSTISTLRQDNHHLKEILQQKEEYIEELSDDIKKLRDKERLHNHLRELDRQTIDRLRSALAKSNSGICKDVNREAYLFSKSTISTSTAAASSSPRPYRKTVPCKDVQVPFTQSSSDERADQSGIEIKGHQTVTRPSHINKIKSQSTKMKLHHLAKKKGLARWCRWRRLKLIRRKPLRASKGAQSCLILTHSASEA